MKSVVFNTLYCSIQFKSFLRKLCHKPTNKIKYQIESNEQRVISESIGRKLFVKTVNSTQTNQKSKIHKRENRQRIFTKSKRKTQTRIAIANFTIFFGFSIFEFNLKEMVNLVLLSFVNLGTAKKKTMNSGGQ